MPVERGGSEQGRRKVKKKKKKGRTAADFKQVAVADDEGFLVAIDDDGELLYYVVVAKDDGTDSGDYSTARLEDRSCAFLSTDQSLVDVGRAGEVDGPDPRVMSPRRSQFSTTVVFVPTLIESLLSREDSEVSRGWQLG